METPAEGSQATRLALLLSPPIRGNGVLPSPYVRSRSGTRRKSKTQGLAAKAAAPVILHATRNNSDSNNSAIINNDQNKDNNKDNHNNISSSNKTTSTPM